MLAERAFKKSYLALQMDIVLHALYFNVMQFKHITISLRILELPLILYWCKDINITKTEYRRVFERLHLLIKRDILVYDLYIAQLIFTF